MNSTEGIDPEGLTLRAPCRSVHLAPGMYTSASGKLIGRDRPYSNAYPSSAADPLVGLSFGERIGVLTRRIVIEYVSVAWQCPGVIGHFLHSRDYLIETLDSCRPTIWRRRGIRLSHCSTRNEVLLATEGRSSFLSVFICGQ
jgi:hypothetical protein